MQKEAKPPSPVRCAIYTRKSTEHGLNREFNTLDAQREAAEAYIAIQRHANWIAIERRYDDGGIWKIELISTPQHLLIQIDYTHQNTFQI